MTTDQQKSITPVGHGNSVAAWTSVTIIMIGALIGCFAAVGSSLVLAIASAVVILAGVAAWKILLSMGYGEKPHH